VDLSGRVRGVRYSDMQRHKLGELHKRCNRYRPAAAAQLFAKLTRSGPMGGVGNHQAIHLGRAGLVCVEVAAWRQGLALVPRTLTPWPALSDYLNALFALLEHLRGACRTLCCV
jgi:hypothetical protein